MCAFENLMEIVWRSALEFILVINSHLGNRTSHSAHNEYEKARVLYTLAPILTEEKQWETKEREQGP